MIRSDMAVLCHRLDAASRVDPGACARHTALMIPAITPLYAGLLGFLFLALSFRIPMLRLRLRVGIGDGGHPELARAIRVQANFAEYVPLCLLLLWLVELEGYSPWFVHCMGLLLLVARGLHAYGLSRTANASRPRFLGTLLTFAVLLLTSGLAVLAAALKLAQ